jgi:hypothetical protein
VECPVLLVASKILQETNISSNVSPFMFSATSSVAHTTNYHRTLQRLGRIRPLTEVQPLRPRQRQAILTKLEQHEAKLADLASKYSVSTATSASFITRVHGYSRPPTIQTAFDRLRLRHLHFLLTQSHDESSRMKAQQQRLLSRASFERRWKEAKSFRAGLRNDFHDLRQEFYGTQRVGRHISSP